MGKRYLLLTTLFLLLLSGCRKEREQEKISITIQPDWGAHEKPGHLKILLYDAKDKVTEYAISSGGEVIKVPKGEYRILIFNNDAQHVAFMKLSSFDKAYAVMARTKAAMEAPDGLYSYNGTITAADGGSSLTPSMKSLIVKASFEISLEHADGVTQVNSSMRNLPDAVTLGGGIPFYTAPEQESVVKMEPVAVSGNTYVFYCSSFGSTLVEGDPNPTSRIFADIGITYENGENKVITADVTEAMTQASGEGGGDVVITMEEIGFKAVVKGWVVKSGNGEIDDDK